MLISDNMVKKFQVMTYSSGCAIVLVSNLHNRGRPKCRFSTIGTGNSSGSATPVPEPELALEVGDRALPLDRKLCCIR